MKDLLLSVFIGVHLWFLRLTPFRKRSINLPFIASLERPNKSSRR